MRQKQLLSPHPQARRDRAVTAILAALIGYLAALPLLRVGGRVDVWLIQRLETTDGMIYFWFWLDLPGWLRALPIFGLLFVGVFGGLSWAGARLRRESLLTRHLREICTVRSPGIATSTLDELVEFGVVGDNEREDAEAALAQLVNEGVIRYDPPLYSLAVARCAGRIGEIYPYHCTLPAGHPGQHKSWEGGKVVAAWT